MFKFNALNTKTGDCIEYSPLKETDEIDMFVSAVMHVTARTGMKVTAYVTNEYLDRLKESPKYFVNWKEDTHTLYIAGMPTVIDDEQDIDLVLKY